MLTTIIHQMKKIAEEDKKMLEMFKGELLKCMAEKEDMDEFTEWFNQMMDRRMEKLVEVDTYLIREGELV